ncbi:putative HC-toxin efflux carrier TOXA [Venustampulla echinocandica]|uniref:Putative HC-toxin efflux carrier TOXA n=1 Tax=Venustampulla echinocandica TaxID=2656787 RepID=A0A370TKY6_9HELO|nr:putative HC-toxin efflux carrier TOXA [Venustampulla echinocandica]RDL36192.1 putative HC-toxin efflux carrier TOXA [Venustampulla echinocandica]
MAATEPLPAAVVRDTVRVPHPPTRAAEGTENSTLSDSPLVSAGIPRLDQDAPPSHPAVRSSNDATMLDTEGEVPKVEGQEETENVTKYPGGLSLALLTLGLCLAMFVVALDNTVIATAIPRITTDFDSLNDVGWYGSAYLLTNCALQPTFGKIYTLFDVKWTYISALLIFELGSILCAAASTSTMFIVGRAVAGIGAAALFSGAMNIIGFSVPLRHRAIYIGALSSMFGIASIVGPIIGGAFTDRVSWRWCFWINLPFGGVTILAVFLVFKNPDHKKNDKSIKQKFLELDILGAISLISAVICLLLALKWGGVTYPWSDSKVWGCLLGFFLLLAVFIAIQFKLGDKGTIPPRILKQRTVWSCCWFTFILGLGLYVLIFYLPFYFQAVKGVSAENSGIRMIPLLVSITLASIVSGGMTTTFGYYVPFLWFSAIFFTIGSSLLYTLEVSSYAGKWIGYQLLAGIGCGLSLQVPFVATQVVLSVEDQAIGNSLVVFFTSLGGALAVSIAQNIFSNSLVSELTKRIPVDQIPAIVAAGAAKVAEATPPRFLPDVLYSYNYAVTRAFIVAIAAGGIGLLLSLFPEWKSVKTAKSTDTTAEAETIEKTTTDETTTNEATTDETTVETKSGVGAEVKSK